MARLTRHRGGLHTAVTLYGELESGARSVADQIG